MRRSHAFWPLLCTAAVLAGCGGGGGAGGPPADTTPDAFDFPAVTGATFGSPVDSSEITVAGINAAAPIAVSGGQYSINGGGFTSAAGTVSAGQRVRVRAAASPNPSTATAATLTIGGLSATFSVTTEPADPTPSTFSIAAAKNAVRGSAVVSAAVSVGGINVPVAIAVTGGEYSIDGGAFGGAAGTVANGQSVRVRATASTTPGGVVEAALTIGGIAASFSVTTSTDVTAPAVSVLFPLPQTRTGAGTITLRGTATDASGSVAAVRVNGVAATTSNGYATWTAAVPLAPGANALTVAAEDAFLNGNPAAAQVGVTRHARFVSPRSVAIDSANDRAFVLDSGARTLYAVSLTTGARSILSDATTPSALNPMWAPRALAFDEDNDRILVLDHFDVSIKAVDVTTGARSVLSGPGTPNANVPFTSVNAIALDAVNDRLLVLHAAPPAIIAVDLDTGARTLLSDATTPSGGPLFQTPRAMALDSANSRVLVTNVGPDYAIYAVSLSDGQRSILSDDSTPNGVNPLSFPQAIAVDFVNARALVAQSASRSIVAVDLVSGARTAFSSAVVPNGDNPFGSPTALALDAAHGRVVVTDSNLHALLAVRLTDGERSFISRDEPANAAHPLVEPTGMAYDGANGRLLVSDQGLDALLAVDLTTAQRTVLSSSAIPNGTNPFRRPRSVVLDPLTPRAFVLDAGEPGIGPPGVLEVDLVSGVRAVLSNTITPNANTPFQVPFDMALDAARSRLLVTERDYRAVLGVDLGTGARTVVSDDATPNANTPFAEPQGIAVHAAQGRAIVASSAVGPTSRILSFDLDTGARTVMSGPDFPDNVNPLTDPTPIALDVPRNRAFVADRLREALYHVDLATGARTVVSSNSARGENPFDNVISMSYDANRDVVFVMNGNAAAVLVVDVPTGQRVYLLR